eukprot:COSAG05_NODE_379_length_10567_cov_18.553687_15_plen_143_part_00
MRHGLHFAEFTLRRGNKAYVGIAREPKDQRATLPARITQTDQGWGYYCSDGHVWHDNAFSEWEGREGARDGDMIGMLLDFNNGAFVIYKNGTQLGEVFCIRRDLEQIYYHKGGIAGLYARAGKYPNTMHSKPASTRLPDENG